MAKISARGDTERRRWRRGDDGAELVLTERGRLLWKPLRGASFTLLVSTSTPGYAEAHASERCMERVR